MKHYDTWLKLNFDAAATDGNVTVEDAIKGAKLYAEHCVGPLEREIEKLKQEVNQKTVKYWPTEKY